MPRKRIEIKCYVDNCLNSAKSLGLCQYHYNKKRLEEKPERAKAGLRGHPFYHLWFERKQNGILCEAWLDFEEFIKGVSPKPEGEFFLIRLTNEPFGPDNFKWQEHLRRKFGETDREWHARKWKHRHSANPSLESDRNLKRKFGLTRDCYNKKLEAQNFVCAICGETEKAVDGKCNTTKKLAVDHNHKNGKIRDLLCWRCNTTIGKINEDLDLIDKMKAYLIKHLD